MKKRVRLIKWLFWFTLALAVIIIYKTFDKMGGIFEWLDTFISILSPFVYGFAIAFMLYRPVKKLSSFLIKKCHVKPKPAFYLALAFEYLFCFAVITALIMFFIPKLLDGAIKFIQSVPELASSVQNYIAANVSPEVLEWINIDEMISSIKVDDVLAQLSIVESTVRSVVFGLSSWLITFVMGVIISVYMILRKESICNVASNVTMLYLKPRIHAKIKEYLLDICNIFYKYLYGHVLECLVYSIVCWLIMLVIGTPYSSTMGLITFICSLVPYFGCFISIALITVISLSTGELFTAVATLVALVVWFELESNVIAPKIIGDSIGLNPLWVIFAITLGGGLFGFAGILLGIPIFASLRMILIDVYETKKADAKKMEKAVEPPVD